MRKMTNRELARRSGYSNAHVSRTLRGVTPPSIRCALQLSKVLGIGINEFLVRIREGRMDK